MTFTSHQQYQFTKKQKARETGQERRGSDSIAIDAGRNSSIETSFPNGSPLKPNEGEKSAGLVSMQQRSGEIENDTARLLPGGGELF